MTKPGHALKVGDIITVSGEHVTIKRALRKSKLYHGAMIYETDKRIIVAISPNEEVEVV